jgi:Autographiviridae DNA polymerase
MSEIKECFISRFPNGVLLESDFSQLEVVGLAALSYDPVLIDDLLAGRDMHRYFAAALFDKPLLDVTKSERTFTKKMTFQLQYGSGADNMSRKLGIAKEKAERFIQLYYERYTRVKAWQDEVIEAVKRSRSPSKRWGAGEVPLGRGQWASPTGRLYTFYEMGKPEGWKGHNKEPDFMPTQIKNYPVQGFATGDIMALFRARVFRWWVNSPKSVRENVLPNNTVHDSIMFDCANDGWAAFVAEEMEFIAGNLVGEVEKLWGLKCPVPFKIESKYGPTWASMEKVA